MLTYAGKGRSVAEQVDLNGLLAGMRPLMEASASRGAAFQFELAPGLPEVRGDPSQLQQMVMNLVTNAWEALEGGRGTVTVRTGERTLDRPALNAEAPAIPIRPGRYLVLEVADTGGGIPPDLRNRIFDPFFSTKFLGRGLGLPALLGILRGHGGGIQVESAAGQGACFRLFLPVPE
jgi:signal transduction histidine kinase